jgi:hypothetical protein
MNGKGEELKKKIDKICTSKNKLLISNDSLEKNCSAKN